MRSIGRSGLALTGLAAILAACWSTRPNPRYCDAGRPCAGAGEQCDLTTHECVAADVDLAAPDLTGGPDLRPMCTANAGCTAAGSPICDDATHACRACAAADCAGFAGHPVCAPSGACVECVSRDDCAAAGKTCDTGTLTCVGCTANADCTSGACRADHACAAAADLVHVDNKNGLCTGAVHAGTAADPYCQVAPALLASGSTILVAASSVDYDAISVTAAVDKAIVGPGRSGANVARFAQSTKNGVAVNPAGGTAKLSITGVVLVGSAGGTNAPGALCFQGAGTSATLIITRSAIMNSGAHGVDVVGCTIKLDANEITLNQGGGVRLIDSAFTLTNNIIALNGNMGTATIPGVSINAASSGTFAYNTIVKNLVSAGVAGIDCSAAAHAISASIVAQNTAAGGTQFNGACTLTNVVAGASETAAAATKLDPAFVGTSNFRLDMTLGAPRTANQACCVDQIAAGATDHDVDGYHRPTGAKWDIGAAEAQ